VDDIPKLQIDTSHIEGRLELRVAGEIDMLTATELTEALTQLAAKDGQVTVDLGDVTFIDSSGLRALFAFASSTNGNGPLRVVNASPTVLRTLQIVGMTDVPQIEVD
jgi:anti-anti-sigma factor